LNEDDVSNMYYDFADLSSRMSTGEIDATLTTLEQLVGAVCERLSETLERPSLFDPFEEHATVNLPLREIIAPRRSESLADMILSDDNLPITLNGDQKAQLAALLRDYMTIEHRETFSQLKYKHFKLVAKYELLSRRLLRGHKIDRANEDEVLQLRNERNSMNTLIVDLKTKVRDYTVRYMNTEKEVKYLQDKNR
jgi:hypothetical protein